MENLNRLSVSELIPRYLREQQRWFLENFEIELLYGSYWNNPAPWFIKRRKITDNFVLFPNSPIYIETDRERKLIDRGEFLIIPHGHWHSYGLESGIAESSEHIILHILFHSDTYANLLELFPSYFHKLDNYDYWYEKFKKVICLDDNSHKAGKKYGELAMTELILELFHLEGESVHIPESQIDIRIESVIKFITEHYSDDLVIEDLAEEAGLRPVQFRKLFKKESGKSPKAYLISVRIRNAIEMLRKTSMKISLISEKTGFNDKNYFSAAFKHATGRAPTEFRDLYS